MSLNTVGTTVEEEDHQEYLYEYFDDISGMKLEGRMVEAVRREELEEMKKRGTYTKVPVSECWAKTGKKPVGVKFIDVNKGDMEHPTYRSRLVAREFRDGMATWLAATHPLEAIKMLPSMAATREPEAVGIHRH